MKIAPAFLTLPAFLTMAVLATALGACSREGRLVVTDGVGITAIRSVCPAVGIPDYTGDVTYFTGKGRSASDIDFTATMSNVATSCDDTGDKVFAQASFDVFARRSDATGARTVSIPYYVTVMQGGSAVQSKRVGEVSVSFADGETRAMGHAKGAAYIDRAAATLPADIRDRVTRKRRAGDADAAVDPLADPIVRDAIKRATFELLVGFQMSDEQLAYNATR